MLKLTLDHIFWLLTAVLFAPVFRQLYASRWENIDYTHAYLILPVSCWLVWRKRAEITRALLLPSSGGASIAGLILLILGAFLFVFGWRLDFLMITTLALIPVLFGIVLFRYNPAIARITAFPILYLLLLVPPPLGILDAITIPMRYMATQMVEFLLQPFYPVVRDGMMMSVGHATIVVGAPCSGFRSLVSIFALALVYAHVIDLERFKKIILLAFVLPLALMLNVVRVIVITLVTYYFGNEAGEGWVHDGSGYAVFLLLLLALMWLGKKLEGAADDD